MSKIVLAIVFILMAGRNYAQQDYFILIQADNNQPFYARMGEGSKVISSSGQGHLILSQLKEGLYTITIGFPKKLFPELQFSFTIYKKDQELQLKDLGEKGWGLFNPQTLELKMPDEKKGDESKNHLEGVKKDDAFSRLMAGVVSDTAVMYNTYAMEATLKESPDSSGKDALAATKLPQTTAGLPVDTTNKEVLPSPPIGKDTTIAVRTMNSPAGADTSKEERSASDSFAVRKDTLKADPVIAGSSSDSAVQKAAVNGTISSSTDSASTTTGTSPVAPGVGPDTGTASAPAGSSVLPRKLSSVVKLSERKTSKGVRLVYADHNKDSKADTIVVIIPIDTVTRMAQHPGEINTLTVSSPRSDSPTSASARPDHSANGPGISAQKTASASLLYRPDTSQKKTPAKSLFINSDCKNFATDYDVDKLRVKMLESSKDEDRILAAHKVFKTRCFTTRQIRALSEVFTSDAQKFRFFETAYPFVSDDRFKELTDLLADPVYNSKFRSMTGQQ